jgi:transcriptional regulator with XRE-family HTH domain
LLQREVAERAGISQSFYSRIELGRGSRASLETLAACALACDSQLAAFIEALPGASLPRDIEHVRRQQAVISLAAAGGWRAMPERPIDPESPRSRSVDVLLERAVDRRLPSSRSST